MCKADIDTARSNHKQDMPVLRHLRRLAVTLGVAAFTHAPSLDAQENRMDPMSKEALERASVPTMRHTRS